MLCKTKAVSALQDGCSRLGLPSSTATALVQFLSVKRTHDQFVAADSRQLSMSPGSTLDKLCHFMLLNTAVSSLVHDLLGGIVEHRGVDSTDLSDGTKLLQRLYALNILRLEGHEPDVALWMEPGTALHTLHLTASPVAALQHLPGGGQLYDTPTLTQQQQGQLVQALQLLYTEGEGTSGSNLQQPQQQQQQPTTIHPPHAAACAATVACAVQPEAKRPRLQQPVPAAAAASAGASPAAVQQRGAAAGEGQVTGSKLNIILRDLQGGEVHFSVVPWVMFRRVLEFYAAHKNIPVEKLRLVCYGARIYEWHTPELLELEEGDVINVFLPQEGC